MIAATDQWRAALAEFRDTLKLRGYAPSTITRVHRQVTKFAKETSPAGPWDATHDTLTGWLDGLRCTEQARYGYRTSLRTFYRWAHRAGRVYVDPTEQVHHTCTSPFVAPDWHLAIADYLQYLRAAGKPPTSVNLRRTQLSRLARQIGHQDPWTVTMDDLTDWLARHRWSRETQRSHRAAVRSFYGWAADTARIDTDPAARLPVIRAATPTPRPGSDTDYLAALHAAPPRETLMLRLSAELGLRRAEVAICHTRDLTREPDGWWLAVHGKGGKARRLPVPDALAALIREQPSGWLFPGNDSGHLSPPYVGKRVSQLLPPGTTMHALRHRFATRAYNIDRDVFAVQQLLGHASPETTRRYVLVPGENLRRLVTAIN